jgi:hypothetical protein
MSSQMQIGMGVQMIDAQLAVLPYTLEATCYRGVHVSKQQYLIPARRQSTNL